MLWEVAHDKLPLIGDIGVGLTSVNPENMGFLCHVDGSWKEDEISSGLGWHCTHSEDEEYLVGGRNLRRILSPLYSELEALIWDMLCLIGY